MAEPRTPPAEAPDREEGQRFELFDLSISIGPEGLPWLSAQSSVGFVHSVPRADPDVPRLADLLDLVYDYADSIAFAEAEPRPELAVALGTLVFGEPMVLRLFHATRGVAADKGARLLVRVLASPHMASLPWELLPDPEDGDQAAPGRYLVLAPDVQVVRMARGRSYAARPRPLHTPINLLVVLSSPVFPADTEGRYDFDIFEVKRNLMNELAPMVRAGLLRMDVEDRPTVDNLRHRIASQQRGYHVFHYVGHALPDRIVLEDRMGRAETLGSERLIELLRLCPDLRLAVFAGCETARPRDDPASVDVGRAVGWRDLLSLADRCVQGACPNVIGMQAVLPLSTERVFTRFLYQGLSSGYSVVDALRIARGAIRGEDRIGVPVLDWSVPVLFVGGGEPAALLPPAPQGRPQQDRTAVDLTLGLVQSSERFLARDLALRQVVEVLSGKARERVIIVTGPAGTGKTMLIDRALDELRSSVELILFVHMRRLMPEVHRSCAGLASDAVPDVDGLFAIDPDSTLRRMCELADELLRRAGRTPPVRDARWTLRDWWERLVGDVVQLRCVVAVDDLGQLDQLQAVLLRGAAAAWLAARIAARRAGTPDEVIVADAEALLTALQRRAEAEQAGLPLPDQRIDPGLQVLAASLPGLPARLTGRVAEALEQALVDVLSQPAAQAPLEEALARLATRAAGGTDTDRIVAAIAHLERLREAAASALQILVERRAGVRTALTANQPLRGLIELAAEDVFELRLAPLAWQDTWRWLRRNLPGLLRYGEDYLSRLWTRLGARADLWEELELKAIRDPRADLERIVDELAPATRVTAAGQRPLAGRRRGERPLRIAVAGPHLTDPEQAAIALTQLAIRHGVGGRVTADMGAEGGALAYLIHEAPAFDEDGSTTIGEIVGWLGRLAPLRPDIVLLDYGQVIGAADFEAHRAQDPQVPLLQGMIHHSLLIGAGGNDPAPDSLTVPGAYSEVFSIGAAKADGTRAPYSSWSPARGKPDLFMDDQLGNTPLAAVIAAQGPDGFIGSSAAAMHAMAAAVMVWSLLPQLTPGGVRRLLEQAARPMGEPGQAFLEIGRAVELARRRLVYGALQQGPCTTMTLSALTGLQTDVLANTLAAMSADRQIEINRSGRLERVQIAGPH